MEKNDNTLVIGDRKFELVPLTFGVLKKIQPLLGTVTGLAGAGRLPTIAELEACQQVVVIALEKHPQAPDIAFLDEHLTIANLPGIVEKLFSVSGVKTAPGEAPTVP